MAEMSCEIRIGGRISDRAQLRCLLEGIELLGLEPVEVRQIPDESARRGGWPR